MRAVSCSSGVVMTPREGDSRRCGVVGSDWLVLFVMGELFTARKPPSPKTVDLSMVRDLSTTGKYQRPIDISVYLSRSAIEENKQM